MSKNIQLTDIWQKQSDENIISIGQINFLNCLPVNYTLRTWAHERLIITNGYPALINTLMRDNQVHIASVSSIEYLYNQDIYSLIETISISSYGEVGSVMLFSNCNIEELSNKTIGIPYTSASSIALLKIFLNKYGVINPVFKVHKYESSLPYALENKFDAVLYIGDPALITNHTYNEIIKYDLGKLWKDLTGLPMVFGTWVAGTDWKNSHSGDFEWISFLLNKAVDAGLTIYFNDVLNIAEEAIKFDKKIIEHYLTKNISYQFTDHHLESLKLFKYLYDRILRQE